MKLFFTSQAKDSFDRIAGKDPSGAGRIKRILKDTLDHPEAGLGSPTRLEGAFSGLWTRSWSYQDFIIYAFDEESVTVYAIGLASTDKIPEGIQVDAYSEEDYQSVLRQMSSNRGKGNEPKVGIFWYNRSTASLFGVVSHPVRDYSRANASEGRITCSELHEDVWKREYRRQKYHGDGSGPFIGAYQDKPRGRIFYHMDEDRFEVAVGKWIEECPQAYEEILQEFDLPPEKTRVKYAIHWDIGQSWR